MGSASTFDVVVVGGGGSGLAAAVSAAEAGARVLLLEKNAALGGTTGISVGSFDRSPKEAIRHYGVGLRIGELSLGERFEGVLPWGHIDNRPFLRCLHGYGLCLWRLGRFDEAERVFERMLWLNPSDNQGARLLLEDVRARKAWEESQEDR